MKTQIVFGSALLDMDFSERQLVNAEHPAYSLDFGHIQELKGEN